MPQSLSNFDWSAKKDLVKSELRINAQLIIKASLLFPYIHGPAP